LYWRHAGSAA